MSSTGAAVAWTQRRDEWRRLGVHVDGGKLAEEVLSDLAALDVNGEEALSLVAAAGESGYSADHLGRLVRCGRLQNAGRANTPKIQRCDLPRKPGDLPSAARTAILPGDRRRIATSVLHLSQGERDG